MAKVDDWFFLFMQKHMARHPREDWPDHTTTAGEQFWVGWRSLFVKHGITEAIADEASTILMADPPKFVADHPPAMVKLCQRLFREAQAAGGGDLTAREGALVASRDCWDCQGQGLTIRYRHKSGEPGRRTITLYCLCPYGRFLERSHAASSPDVRRRIYDLADYSWLQGQDCRFLFPPGVRIIKSVEELRAHMKAAGPIGSAKPAPQGVITQEQEPPYRPNSTYDDIPF